MGKAKERYTLEEAANIIAQSDAAGSNQILQKLRQSVGKGKLSAYFQGSHSPFVFDDAFITPRLNDLWELENAGKINELAPFARGFTQFDIEFDQRFRYSVFPNNLEAYWDDLNKWLDINYARLPYRFPDPETPDTFAAAKVKQGITKGAVINAFEGVYFNRDQWGKALGKNIPDWLSTCRVTPGKQGSRTSATWNPVLIAVALFDKEITIKQLDTVFFSMKDWDEEWRETSSSFRD